MANTWSGVVGVALLVCLPCIANAQSGGEDVRKRHVNCAAVLGVAGAYSADKELQEKLLAAAELLGLWASELITNQPTEARTDQTARELLDQAIAIRRTIKVKAGTPAATKEFEEKYGSAQKACEAWFLAEMKKRKGG